VLKFDDLKMTNPAIQNDFSFYRRNISRMKQIEVRVTSCEYSLRVLGSAGRLWWLGGG
jgi:hypothetical protein